MSRPKVAVSLKVAALVFLLVASFFFGFLCHRLAIFPYQPVTKVYHAAIPALPRWLGGGESFSREQWSAARGTAAVASDVSERLLSLPYLQGYRPAQGRTGVRLWARSFAQDGLNLYVSGHASEAELIDMEGRTLHRWAYSFRKAWPDLEVAPENTGHERFWRNAFLAPNGDLLGIFEGIGIVRLDAGSRLVWAAPCGCHHSLAVDEDQSIWALSRRRTTRDWGRGPTQVLDDSLVHLSPTGKVLKTISLLQALRQSDFASVLAYAPRFGDVLHANHLQLLGRAERSDFALDRPGYALVSFATISAVAVLDLASERIVWVQSGPWYGQHTPTLLTNGNLLVFDNGGNFTAGRSRVVEFDSRTGNVVWRFGEGAGEAFESYSNGGVERLSNGNTLIVESNGGRAFEVRPDRKVVWEFHNPHTADGGRLVATLFAMHRYGAEVCARLGCLQDAAAAAVVPAPLPE